MVEFQDSKLGFHWDLGTDPLSSLNVYLDVLTGSLNFYKLRDSLHILCNINYGAQHTLKKKIRIVVAGKEKAKGLSSTQLLAILIKQAST